MFTSFTALTLLVYLFIWFDAMTAYKQIMPRLTTALTGMQNTIKSTLHWVMYAINRKEMKT